MAVERTLRALLAEGRRDGSLGPGSKLPTERDRVERLAVPRGAIRRALEVLERDGVVGRYVGRGTFLTDSAQGHVEGAPPDTSSAEIMQVRQLLEPQVAALAARVATQADLDRITEYVVSAARAGCRQRSGGGGACCPVHRWGRSSSAPRRSRCARRSRPAA